LEQVRRIYVKQYILGRILNYGTIIIIRLNGSEQKIKNISAPFNVSKLGAKVE